MSIRSRLYRLILFGLVWMLLAPVAQAQSIGASVYGKVLDQSGGAIPGATVKAVHVGTGIEYTYVSDDSGDYDFPQLRLGLYRLEATMPGFQTLVWSGINLELNQRAKVDLILQVGEVTDRVEVFGEAPLLDTATATVGQMITSQQIENLPVAYRVPWSLALVSAGVTPGRRMDVAGRPGFVETANFSVQGSRGVTNEMMIDGVSAVVPEGGSGGSGTVGISYSPAVDATQEFRILTNAFAAEFGKSGGAVVTLTLKSGTNELRGSLYDFMRNDALDANQWFSNRNGLGKSTLRQHQWGGSIGGPVVIPGLYDGRNRTFFFFNYQGYNRSSTGQPVRSSLPTLDMVQGDFSNLRNSAGELITIYDPLTAAAGQPRTPFPNNIIPASRMDPVAVRIASFLPNERRSEGDPYTHLGNNTYQAKAITKEGQWDLKFDQRFSERHSIFFRHSRFDGDLDNPPTLPGSDRSNPNPADYGLWTRPNESRQWGAGHTWTLGPKTIFDWRGGYTRFFAAQDWDTGCHPHRCPSPFKPSEAGFPNYIDSYVAANRMAGFPLIVISGYQALGAGNQQFMIPDSKMLQASVSHIRGPHVLKFGFDGREQHYIRTGGSNQVGYYTFNDAFSRRISNRANPFYEGNSFASFLLGAAASGSLGRPRIADTKSRYFAFYAQDDYKVHPRVTLNLGVRWDISQPMWDRHDQISFVNLNVINPIGAAAGMPDLRGGLEFANQGALAGIRNTMTVDRNNIAPRLGLAYQPSDKWVLRSGFAILYKTQLGEAVPPPSDSFSVTTTMLTSVDGARPFHYLADPFPLGIIEPQMGADGLFTNVGLNASGIVGRDSSKVPYVIQWNLTIQRQLSSTMMVELGYAGNRGRQLDRRAINWNELAPEHVALGPALLEMVPNPFYGIPEISATSALARPLIQRGQLLRPYPHFGTVSIWNRNGANSEHHGFHAKFEKRFAHGLSALASYTNSKTMDDYSGIPSWLGSSPAGDRTRYDTKREWAVSEEDVSQRFVTSFSYQLPFGKGRNWLSNGSGIAEAFLGGWDLNGIVTFDTGIPINVVGGTAYHAFGAGTQRPNRVADGKLSGSAQSRLGGWFDTSAFTNPEPFTLGNTGRTVPQIRTDGTSNLDLSLFKNFPINERFNLQCRAEFFNFTNSPTFSHPNRSFGALDFGRVSSTANYARQVQMALRLTF